jgi:hypothetical protein
MTAENSIANDVYIDMNLTQSSSSSSSSFVLEGVVKHQHPEAIRLAKQSERVKTKTFLTNKRNFPQKNRPLPAQKLAVENPLSVSLKRDRTTAGAVALNVCDRRGTKPAATSALGREQYPKCRQVSTRRGTKPAATSALGREQNPKNDTWAEKRLNSRLLLLEVADSKAKQSDLKDESRKIQLQLARERKAEKKARREASIAMKKEKQEKRREIKAAAMEMKLLSIQRRAEERAAKKLMMAQMTKVEKVKEVTAMKEDLRLALALSKRRKAHYAKEKAYQLTMAPNQTKANCSGMTGGKKNKFADFSVMEYEHDRNNAMTGEKRTDTSMMKNEIIRLKEKLYRLQGKKEEREEADIMMSSLENFCPFLLGGLCAFDEDDQTIDQLTEPSSLARWEVIDEINLARDD